MEQLRFSPRNKEQAHGENLHTVYDDTKSFNIIRHELLNLY